MGSMFSKHIHSQPENSHTPKTTTISIQEALGTSPSLPTPSNILVISAARETSNPTPFYHSVKMSKDMEQKILTWILVAAVMIFWLGFIVTWIAGRKARRASNEGLQFADEKDISTYTIDSTTRDYRRYLLHSLCKSPQEIVGVVPKDFDINKTSNCTICDGEKFSNCTDKNCNWFYGTSIFDHATQKQEYWRFGGMVFSEDVKAGSIFLDREREARDEEGEKRRLEEEDRLVRYIVGVQKERWREGNGKEKVEEGKRQLREAEQKYFSDTVAGFEGNKEEERVEVGGFSVRTEEVPLDADPTDVMGDEKAREEERQAFQSLLRLLASSGGSQ